jgi:broad specificity phosphatase PhoE
MRVHLVRHGQVENPNNILYGRQPGWYLSSLGKEMAAGVADWSKALDLGALHVSPISKAHDLWITTDDRLIEAANVFEGKPFGVGDGVLKHPASWRHLYNPFKPSWGEPYVDQINRMLGAAFTARDAAKAAGKSDAICVSHQLPIWIVRSAIEGRPMLHDPRKRQCSLCSVTTIHFDDDGMITDLTYQEPVKHLLPAKK